MFATIATLTATTALLALFSSRHFRSARAGAVSALLFLCMPVIWFAVRDAAPQFVLLPFVLAWLLATGEFVSTGRLIWIALSGAAAAQLFYLHRAGMVMGVAYLGIGALAVVLRKDRVAALAALAAGFSVAVAPFVFSWWRDPAIVTAGIKAYGLYDADRFNLLQGAREITSWTGLTVRSEVYWDFFNPALLFGGEVFLLPFAIPLIRGLWVYLTASRGVMDWVVLAVFAAAPAAAALIAQPPVGSRLILLAPAAAIIAARGCYPGAFRTRAAGSPATPAIVATTR